MAEIIPRWEWRAFAEGFGAVEERIMGLGEPFSRESSETYIMSRRSGDNTKVRDELMDIKTLRQVNEQQLEQWFPLMKSGFPLPKGELDKVCASWKIDAPDIDAMAYDDFIGKLVGEEADLQAVAVYKLRHGFKLRGAILELAEVSFDGKPFKTICVEHEDPELVWSVVEELGLADRENVNYLKAIKRSIGWEA